MIDKNDLGYWQMAFDERAGILEYDENMPRKKAEALARLWIVEQRGNLNGIKTEKLSLPPRNML